MQNVYLLLNKQPDYNIYYYQGLQSELFLIPMFSKLIEFHKLHSIWLVIEISTRCP